MLTYSMMTMLYLIVTGVRGEWVGLLRPLVFVHAVLIVLLGSAWLKQPKSRATIVRYPGHRAL